MKMRRLYTAMIPVFAGLMLSMHIMADPLSKADAAVS